MARSNRKHGARPRLDRDWPVADLRARRVRRSLAGDRYARRCLPPRGAPRSGPWPGASADRETPSACRASGRWGPPLRHPTIIGTGCIQAQNLGATSTEEACPRRSRDHTSAIENLDPGQGKTRGRLPRVAVGTSRLYVHDRLPMRGHPSGMGQPLVDRAAERHRGMCVHQLLLNRLSRVLPHAAATSETSTLVPRALASRFCRDGHEAWVRSHPPPAVSNSVIHCVGADGIAPLPLVVWWKSGQQLRRGHRKDMEPSARQYAIHVDHRRRLSRSLQEFSDGGARRRECRSGKISHGEC
jgi:hypothetical protein